MQQTFRTIRKQHAVQRLRRCLLVHKVTENPLYNKQLQGIVEAQDIRHAILIQRLEKSVKHHHLCGLRVKVRWNLSRTFLKLIPVSFDNFFFSFFASGDLSPFWPGPAVPCHSNPFNLVFCSQRWVNPADITCTSVSSLCSINCLGQVLHPCSPSILCLNYCTLRSIADAHVTK